MNLNEIINEGRRLQRPSLLLDSNGSGKPVAIWYGHYGLKVTKDSHRCWLSVHAPAIPDCDLKGWLSIYTNDKTCNGGKVRITKSRPKHAGLNLYGREINVLPPIEILAERGSPAFQKWVRQEKVSFNPSSWQAPVKKYVTMQIEEDPFTWPNSYARLGGWSPWEKGWRDFEGGKLLIQTYMDSEPWVEVWQLDSGELRVVQYIT